MPTRPPVLGQKRQQASARDRRRLFDEQRGTNDQRGYDWQWRQFRKKFIASVVAEDPFCGICHGPFGRKRDIEVHHEKKLADHPELKYERENLKAICKACHSKLTSQGL